MRVSLLLLLFAAAGCTNIVCGKGTKQVQNQMSGNVECVPVDQVGPDPCVNDADAGTIIIGGKCQSAIQCDPATSKPVVQADGTILCKGTGAAGPVCSAPKTGTICVDGTVLDFKTKMPIANLPLAMFEPVTFLSDPGNAQPFATTMSDGDGKFVFQDAAAPGTLIALASPNPRMGVAMWATGGTGTQVVPGQIYHLDGVTVEKTVVDGWKTMAGIDYSMGAGVDCYYSDASRASTNDFTWYEASPVTGVQIADGSSAMPIANAKYFGPSLDMISASTSTTALGCGIVQVSVLTSFTGKGPGGMTWEVHPGGSAANVVFFDRFHPM